jgi:ribosomal protein L11 methyltransferase
MHVLELDLSEKPSTSLPSAVVEIPGRAPKLQVYSPLLSPLRSLQKSHGGRIRKLHLRPSIPYQLRIGRKLIITSGNQKLPKRDRSVPRLRIRAGPAFGTGEHGTTRLCLRYLTQFLDRCTKSNPQILDLGCGSGILALACAKLGSLAKGWDNDESAVKEALRNARLNRLNHRAHFQQADVLRKALPPADLILANLYDTLLLQLLPRLRAHRKAGTQLIFSGLLAGQERPILRDAKKLGWKLERRGRIGRWLCLQFR